MGRKYFFGSLPGSPVVKPTLGGHTFHDFTERVRIDVSDGSTNRIPYKGNSSNGTELEPEDIKRIKRAIESRVARVRMIEEKDAWTGKTELVKATGNFYQAHGSRKFRPMPNDAPAARYVYFLPLDEIKDPATFEYGNDIYPPSYEDMYLKKANENSKPAFATAGKATSR